MPSLAMVTLAAVMFFFAESGLVESSLIGTAFFEYDLAVAHRTVGFDLHMGDGAFNGPQIAAGIFGSSRPDRSTTG